MAWDFGTDLNEQLKEHLEGRFAATPHRDRLPSKRVTVKIGDPGDRKPTGVRVSIFSGRDEAPAHTYTDGTGTPVVEETHRVTMDVNADDKGGGRTAVEQVYRVLKSIFTEDAERNLLIARGIFNHRETAEEFRMEGVEYNRPLTITCNTDTKL